MSIREKLHYTPRRQSNWSLFWLCTSWASYVAAAFFTVWLLRR